MSLARVLYSRISHLGPAGSPNRRRQSLRPSIGASVCIWGWKLGCESALSCEAGFTERRGARWVVDPILSTPVPARTLRLRQDFRSGRLNLITDAGAQLQPQCGDDFEDGIKTWAAFT